jgi:hypothetical protein
MPTGPNTSCKGRYFTNNAYLSPIPLNFNSTSGIGWYFHLQPTIDQPLANQSQPTIKIRQPTIGWLITGLALIVPAGVGAHDELCCIGMVWYE